MNLRTINATRYVTPLREGGSLPAIIEADIDRTARNANMLIWHRRLWPIDHGAALYFHHTWKNYLDRSRDSFPAIKDHVLLDFANNLQAVDSKMTQLLAPDIIERIVKLIPDAWLVGDSPFSSMDEHRDAYLNYLLNRLKLPHTFLEEAIRARSLHV